MRRPRWRKMTWVMIAWWAIILVLVVGVASLHGADCAGHASVMRCSTAKTLGVGIFLLIGALGSAGLGLVWVLTRPRGGHSPGL